MAMDNPMVGATVAVAIAKNQKGETSLRLRALPRAACPKGLPCGESLFIFPKTGDAGKPYRLTYVTKWLQLMTRR